MSGTAAVQNSFQNAVTATGLQLDNNFATIVAYINDPTNRNNYAADGAATNTVVLTFAPPVVGGYTTGLELTWKWGVTNTGAVVVNANGLGNISVVNPDGTALQAGQGKAGSIGKAVYDGTRAIYISASAQKPAEAKAWGSFSGTATGTITANSSYNIASIVKLGAGTWTISLTTPMSSTGYSVLVTAGDGNAAVAMIPAKAVGGFLITSFASSTGVAANVQEINFSAFGMQ